VGKNEGDVNRTFVGIRNKIPLLLRLIMDFVGTSAVAPELRKMVKKRMN
jgi:hypothetical protein